MLNPFVDPHGLNDIQLVIITVIYGGILYKASDLISGGSELLMLIPAIAGIVGSIILPILGAVPDGMMVLFSGLGDNAQETLKVGIGALAGSTVMLLTFPWFICIFYGAWPEARTVVAAEQAPEQQAARTVAAAEQAPEQEAARTVAAAERAPEHQASIRTRARSRWHMTIRYKESLRNNAAMMLVTTPLFLIIQLPASYEEEKGVSTDGQGVMENIYSLIGMFCCLAMFGVYLWYCWNDANEDKRLAAVIKGIRKKDISIYAALDFVHETRSGVQTSDASTQHRRRLVDEEDMERLKRICQPFFNRYDKNKDNHLCKVELTLLLGDIGAPHDFVDKLMGKYDQNKDGKISFNEFAEFVHEVGLNSEEWAQHAPRQGREQIPDEEEADEPEEMPDDISRLPTQQQRKRVLMRSLWMMGFGTALVLVFSDPMVDVFSEWGRRFNVSGFYVSFVLAPFASNASELLSAYTYAVKKTEKNITTALSTLIGAACMNNTFVLFIFLAIVYFNKLAWQFTAETIAMMIIQLVIGLMAMMGELRQGMGKGIIILLCYPACLFLVWLLENKLGLD